MRTAKTAKQLSEEANKLHVSWTKVNAAYAKLLAQDAMTKSDLASLERLRVSGNKMLAKIGQLRALAEHRA